MNVLGQKSFTPGFWKLPQAIEAWRGLNSKSLCRLRLLDEFRVQARRRIGRVEDMQMATRAGFVTSVTYLIASNSAYKGN
jgi:hypothetical protein